MAERDDILHYLHEYLRVDDWKDYGPQGLQVEGRRQTHRVVTGVSGSVALFEAAIAAGADMVLVHHGIFWERDPRVVRGPLKRRLELLLRHELTLAGYHLCLDAHPEVGNNVLGVRGLGLEEVRPWGEYQGRHIGFRGRWPDGIPVEEAQARVEQFYGRRSDAFLSGPALVRTVGLVSGGAQDMVRAAAEAGLDMFITGEASEFVMAAAAESGIHFLGAGHHATERIGIAAVGELLSRTFGVEHQFIDIPNPI